MLQDLGSDLEERMDREPIPRRSRTMKAKRRAKATVKQRVQLLTVVAALGALFAGVGVASSPSWFTGSDVQPAEAVEQPLAAAPVAADEIWLEDFESASSLAPASLGAYRDSSYLANQFWLNYADCNGAIVAYGSTFSGNTYCSLPAASNSSALTVSARNSRVKVKRMADVLGQLGAGVVGGASDASPVNGSVAATTQRNRAVTAMTNSVSSSSTSLTMLQTRNGIGASASRAGYYLVGIDIAEDSCAVSSNNSRIGLSLAGTTLTGTAIRACNVDGGRYTSPVLDEDPNRSDPWGTNARSVRAGSFASDGAVRLTAAELSAAQIRVWNEISQSAGNDVAFDNLRVLDATPALTKSFSADTIIAGGVSTLTFTVTNTAELAAKNDWAFTDKLPAGLKVATTPNRGGTCVNSAASSTNFAATAVAGSDTISVVGGDLAKGTSSCTITVDVTAAVAGVYTNGSGNISDSTLRAPEDATLTVTAPVTLTVRKVLTDVRKAASDQFALSVRDGARSLSAITTTGTGSQAQGSIDGLRLAPGATVTIHEEVVTTAANGTANTFGYASSYSCVRGDGTEIASGASSSGNLTLPSEPGASVVCTFTNTPQPVQLACDNNHFYSVTNAGSLVQGDIVTGATATVGQWAASTSVNSLGIAEDGKLAYAIARSSTGVEAMLKWTPAGGFERLAAPALTISGDVSQSIVAGAINPVDDRYYFGRFSSGAFDLWSFDESITSGSPYSVIGQFATSGSPNGNGDLAFDQNGNLFVLGATTTGSASSAVIFSVNKDSLAAGGTMTASVSRPQTLAGTDANNALTNVNGIAFSPRGTAYLSDSARAYEFDPTTWVRVGGTARVPTAATDLSSCSSPATISVQKNVVARQSSGDQFALSLTATRPTDVLVATATTTGASTGRQTEQIGPFPAPIGAAYRIAETMSNGAAVAPTYKAVYECYADGVRIANGLGASADFTMPGKLGVAVSCTFFNTPQPVASVTVRKQIVDGLGANAAAGSGWELRTSVATASGASSTLVPSSSRGNAQIADTSGTATWNVLFAGAGDTATVTVGETQQAGYRLDSVTCTVNEASRSVGSTADATAVRLSNTIKPGDRVDCLIVNRPVATLALVVDRTNGTKPASTWTAAASGPTGSIAGPRGAGGASAATVSAGTAYRLSSVGPADASDAAYVTNGVWACADATGAAVAVSAAGDVSLARGSAVTCRIVYATAQIALLKQVEQPQVGFEAKNWTITATPNAFTGLSAQSKVGAEYSSAANGNAASTIEVRPGHGYTLTEALTDQTSKVAYQELRLEQLVNGTWATVNSASITAPAAGQSAVYRFVNAPIPGVVLPLTGGMSTDAFVIGGALILLLALSAAVLHGSRRRSRSTA
jgi:LPXTG-motif cell wall-anchored protein/uncharacterized repeat protein (TIGR01451 family)